jgi:periplasmic divalent cation tolerance protein
MEIVLFYTPVRDAATAETLGRQAVALKLAACANSFPIQSNYFWEDVMQQDAETVLLLKTSHAKKESLRIFLEKNHGYDVPAILSWTAEVNASYGQWVHESTGENSVQG